ncbi:hypothetical protein BTO20_16335 [Mycobacterium dioxanotrophicus]|uniref:Recombinase zinc beta ribbon domain-containing protein n=2 Tax=Mycobacterium dioxanotrophicus TaxID=482462 RepID=A0A1Y0CF35_9MYCO|nr:hypothetical protein BTO20_16335 [Mycobacterium dioxanotrophicus]
MYERLQAILDSNRGAGVRRDASALSGLVKCGECGATMSHDSRMSRGKRYYYYRPHRNCEHPVGMRAHFLEEIAEAVLLGGYGDKEITERKWIPGEDSTTALADAVRRFDALTKQLGVTASRTAQNVLQRQIDAVLAEIQTLEAKPQVEGHWEQVGTGVTWGQAWHGANAEERRTMLREAEIQFTVTGGPDGARSVVI